MVQFNSKVVEYEGYIVTRVSKGEVEKKHARLTWPYQPWGTDSILFQKIHGMVHLVRDEFVHNLLWNRYQDPDGRESVMIVKLGVDFFLTREDAIQKVISMEESLASYFESKARGARNRTIDIKTELESHKDV